MQILICTIIVIKYVKEEELTRRGKRALGRAKQWMESKII